MALSPELREFCHSWRGKAAACSIENINGAFDRFFTSYVAFNRLAVPAGWGFVLNENKFPAGDLIEEVSALHIPLSNPPPVEHARLYFNAVNLQLSRNPGIVPQRVRVDKIFFNRSGLSPAQFFVDFLQSALSPDDAPNVEINVADQLSPFGIFHRALTYSLQESCPIHWARKATYFGF